MEGILKGYDNAVNIVLEDAIEYLGVGEGTQTGTTRELGLVITKGKNVMCVYPMEGTKEVENPFGDYD